jgi:hypothetical protein
MLLRHHPYTSDPIKLTPTHKVDSQLAFYTAKNAMFTWLSHNSHCIIPLSFLETRLVVWQFRSSCYVHLCFNCSLRRALEIFRSHCYSITLGLVFWHLRCTTVQPKISIWTSLYERAVSNVCWQKLPRRPVYRSDWLTLLVTIHKYSNKLLSYIL